MSQEIDEDGVQVGDEYIETHNAFWLAGVTGLSGWQMAWSRS